METGKLLQNDICWLLINEFIVFIYRPEKTHIFLIPLEKLAFISIMGPYLLVKKRRFMKELFLKFSIPSRFNKETKTNKTRNNNPKQKEKHMNSRNE